MSDDPIKQEQKWELKLWHKVVIGTIIFLAGCAFLLFKYHQADKPEPVSGGVQKLTNDANVHPEDTERVALTFSNTRPFNLRVK